jgi:hypothetical protein
MLGGSEKSGWLGVKFTDEVILPTLLLWFSSVFRVPFRWLRIIYSRQDVRVPDRKSGA